VSTAGLLEKADFVCALAAARVALATSTTSAGSSARPSKSYRDVCATHTARPSNKQAVKSDLRAAEKSEEQGSSDEEDGCDEKDGCDDEVACVGCRSREERDAELRATAVDVDAPQEGSAGGSRGGDDECEGRCGGGADGGVQKLKPKPKKKPKSAASPNTTSAKPAPKSKAEAPELVTAQATVPKGTASVATFSELEPQAVQPSKRQKTQGRREAASVTTAAAAETLNKTSLLETQLGLAAGSLKTRRLKELISAIIAGRNMDTLTSKLVREELESRLGLHHNALKPQRAVLAKIIDGIVRSGDSQC